MNLVMSINSILKEYKTDVKINCRDNALCASCDFYEIKIVCDPSFDLVYTQIRGFKSKAKTYENNYDEYLRNEKSYRKIRSFFVQKNLIFEELNDEFITKPFLQKDISTDFPRDFFDNFIFETDSIHTNQSLEKLVETCSKKTSAKKATGIGKNGIDICASYQKRDDPTGA